MPEPTQRHKNHNIVSFAGNQVFRSSYDKIFGLKIM
jgi:hypothetical protein